MREAAIAEKYKLTRKIGQGGMGMVWEAVDQVLQRAVAVKLIDRESVESKQTRARFHREAMALAQLRNDHIVQVYDYGIDDGAPFMVMELLEGEDLEQRLRRDKQLELSAVLHLARQVARALMAASVHGIVHRDLKPANLFLVSNAGSDFVKILDFGVASMQAVADPDNDKIVGTPVYMSPDQLAGGPPSPLWDLWALAVIVYRALTGKLPFHAEALPALMAAICTDPFEPPSALVEGLPGTFDTFFARALSKDPSERYPSAVEFIGALTQAAASSSTTTILAVDDEPDIARLMKVRYRKEIRKGTYKFLFAHDGEQALALLRRHPEIDLILSDINMPVMDGLTMLARVPELAPHVPTVMVSAYGDMGNIREAMNEGAFDFVVKPLDFKDLQATIEKAKRAADASRARESSDSELRSLRKLCSTRIQRRVAEHEAVMAFIGEEIEGTTAVVRVLPPIAEDGQAEAEAVADQVRRINASYELVIPEVRKRDGFVELIDGAQLRAVWTGTDHLARALDACAAMVDAIAQLGGVRRAEAKEQRRLLVGVSTGQLSMHCVGSQVCGRLGYSSFGPVVDEARALVAEPRGPAILVSESVYGRWGNRDFRFQAKETPVTGNTTAYELRWQSESDVQERLAALTGSSTGEGFGRTMLSQTMAGKLGHEQRK